jgi:hypothetical protein
MAIPTKFGAWWRAAQELVRLKGISPNGGKDHDKPSFPTKEARRVDELRRACGVNQRSGLAERRRGDGSV